MSGPVHTVKKLGPEFVDALPTDPAAAVQAIIQTPIDVLDQGVWALAMDKLGDHRFRVYGSDWLFVKALNIPDPWVYEVYICGSKGPSDEVYAHASKIITEEFAAHYMHVHRALADALKQISMDGRRACVACTLISFTQHLIDLQVPGDTSRKPLWLGAHLIQRHIQHLMLSYVAMHTEPDLFLSYVRPKLEALLKAYGPAAFMGIPLTHVQREWIVQESGCCISHLPFIHLAARSGDDMAVRWAVERLGQSVNLRAERTMGAADRTECCTPLDLALEVDMDNPRAFTARRYLQLCGARHCGEAASPVSAAASNARAPGGELSFPSAHRLGLHCRKASGFDYCGEQMYTPEQVAGMYLDTLHRQTHGALGVRLEG